SWRGRIRPVLPDAEHLAINVRTPRTRAAFFLQDEDRAPFTKHEPVTSRPERAVVPGRGQLTRGSVTRDAQRGQRCLAPTGEHDVVDPPLHGTHPEVGRQRTAGPPGDVGTTVPSDALPDGRVALCGVVEPRSRQVGIDHRRTVVEILVQPALVQAPSTSAV